MTQKTHLQKYLDYIKNTGGSPKIEHFDEDWEPIGPMVRLELLDAGMTYEEDGKIFVNP